MAEHHRETDIVRDPETGRVTGYVEHVEHTKRKGGFGGWMLGLLLGVLLIAGGVAIFAADRGGFEQAGIQADRAVDQAATQTGDALENAGDVAENAGDQAESALN